MNPSESNSLTLAIFKNGLIQLMAFLFGVTTSFAFEITSGPIADNLQWQEINQPEPGSLSALAGGTLRLPIFQPVRTQRRFGPGTPTQFSRYLNTLQLPLAGELSKETELVPILAQRWSWNEKNELTIELKPEAQWSDRQPVTTNDLLFTLSFLSNLENAANYQTWLVNNAIESAIYHDDHRITLKLNASTNPRELLSIRLMPAHFYKRSGWPKAFDYLFEPTTGPYVQVRTESKRRILFKRQDNWWANDEPFFKNRFNPKNITLELVQPRYRYYDNLKAGHLDMAIYKHARPSNTEKVAINELLQTLPINRYSINSVEPLYRVLIKNRTFDSPASLISCLQDLNGESLTSVTESFQWTQSEPKPDQFIESPCLEVVKFLKKGEFTYLALNIRAHSEQHIENYLQSLAQYSDQLEVQAVRIPDLQQGYVAWQWIKLPDDLQALTDPLDPFDPVHGGLFWIDPQVKHNTLSRNFWRWPEPGKTIDLSE